MSFLTTEFENILQLFFFLILFFCRSYSKRLPLQGSLCISNNFFVFFRYYRNHISAHGGNTVAAACFEYQIRVEICGKRSFGKGEHGVRMSGADTAASSLPSFCVSFCVDAHGIAGIRAEGGRGSYHRKLKFLHLPLLIVPRWRRHLLCRRTS